jgi:GAF domain-containing protein
MIATLFNLVGEQVRAVFKADIAYVALLDRATGTINFPYQYGEVTNRCLMATAHEQIIATGAPIVINEDMDRRSQELGTHVVGRPGHVVPGRCPSWWAGSAEGVISVQSTQREGVYTADDQRLLSTIAANVGVALQNALLFNETREALQQQTATAEVLKVISGSPTTCSPYSTPSPNAPLRSAARTSAWWRLSTAN